MKIFTDIEKGLGLILIFFITLLVSPHIALASDDHQNVLMTFTNETSKNIIISL